MNKTQIQVLDEAIEVFGKEQQQLKAIEEAGEYIQAQAKYLNYPSEKNHENLIEEIADLEIMLYQVKRIYKIESKVQAIAASKILRLNERLRLMEF